MLSGFMEAKISSETHRFYGPGASDLNGVGKKSLEWDLNDWKWDGDLFVAAPLNAVPLDCRIKQSFPVPAIEGLSNSSSSCSDETDSGINGKRKGDSEKRRMVLVVEEDESYNDTGSLTLKLGGHACPIREADLANWDGKNGKRSKVQGGSSNRAVCQVEGCAADLNDAKDYHRRHKVCEMHAKANRALVGNTMQRFCQQCSRFHLLQEFDERKRSCRRRLAGHNRRRRKTHLDAIGNESSGDRASSFVLISLLRILSNLHSDNTDQSKDQDLLSHLLRNLANLAGSFDARNLSGLVQASQDLQKLATSAGTSSEAAQALLSNGVTAQESSRPLCSTSKMNCTEIRDSSVRPIDQSMSVTIAAVEMPPNRNVTETSLVENLQDIPSQRSTCLVSVQDGLPAKAEALGSLQRVLTSDSVVERVRLKNFDLNSICYDGQESIEGPEKSVTPAEGGIDYFNCPSWVLQDSHQASPPQTSGNSESASAQSLSSSNGDAQSRTDRIVFKLFGKDPSDFPLVLRTQILDWLSHSPTDIESYIRPGCIILTIYLRLAESKWEELHSNLSSSLKRLLDVTGNEFWKTGWVYVRLQHQIAFIYKGQVLLDTPLLLGNHSHCKISSVTPIAVSVSRRINFTVKGFNLACSSTRLLCAFEGKYLVQEPTQPLVHGIDIANEHDRSQFLSFSCSFPNATGRGFVEVDDGLNSGFFPFIVAEHDVCTEIRMLESTINMAWSDDNSQERTSGMKARTQALDFLHEMGWLLRRSYLRSRLENMNSCSNVFPLPRFKWLVEFSMDRDWCAVVKKLLDVMYGGSVDAGGHSVELILSDMALLHGAVQRNSRPMVDLLLRYVPAKVLEKPGSPQKTQVGSGPMKFLFRPDMLGPSDVTPLHIAANRSDAESVLDSLTDDPGLVGIKAWKSALDSTGFTPEDYARSRGFESYIHLVQEKINQKLGAEHVVLIIPGLEDTDATRKQTDGPSFSKLVGLQIDKSKLRLTPQPYCKLCNQQVAYGTRRSSLLYRPAMLSLVGIAAVCVCVGLLLKSLPVVRCVFLPFRWELLGYGSI